MVWEMDMSGDSTVTMVPGRTNMGNNGEIAEDIEVLSRNFAAKTHRMASQENSVVSMVLAEAGWTTLETLKYLNCPREKWKILLGHAWGRCRKSIVKSQITQSVGTS